MKLLGIKPIVISRGMCTLEELDNVVELFEKIHAHM